MTKKLTLIAVALVAVFAIAITAVGNANDALACDKAAKKASASGCDEAASAACAKTASASTCDKSAKTASASACDKSAKTASAGCSKSAKTASSGCSKGKAAVAGYEKTGKGKAACSPEDCKSACCDADAAHAAALKGIVDEIPYRDSHRVVVSGTIECGSCTYKTTTACQPLLKTTDGKVYPLNHSGMVKKMKKSGATSFEVTSKVRNFNGVKYLDVKSFKTI